MKKYSEPAIKRLWETGVLERVGRRFKPDLGHQRPGGAMGTPACQVRAPS